jgi:SAM-dependent methyltransferase
MQYAAFADAYDRLMRDVDYETAVNTVIGELKRRGVLDGALLLDLACGTGTISCLLSDAGYEVIGVDASEEMLMAASGKACKGVPPVYICQKMQELDMYGTVGACVCMLDGLNYLTDEAVLRETLQRVHLFLDPGGIFVFDVNMPEKFRMMDGCCYCDEAEDVFCAWRVAETETKGVYAYLVDMFEKTGRLWRRNSEEHFERPYEKAHMIALLEEAGFTDIKAAPAGFSESELPEHRLFFSAAKANI